MCWSYVARFWGDCRSGLFEKKLRNFRKERVPAELKRDPPLVKDEPMRNVGYASVKAYKRKGKNPVKHQMRKWEKNKPADYKGQCRRRIGAGPGM